jgi:hypothetical protein
MSDTQRIVLRELARRDASCRKTIADATGLPGPGVGNSLASLARWGYATRVGVIDHPRLRYPVTLFAATPAGFDAAAMG